MKKIIGGLAVAASLVAGPVFAQANDSNILSMAGTSPDICLVRGPAVSSVPVNAGLTGETDAAGTITVANLANPATANLQAASITLTIPAMCNGVHSVTLTSATGGLQNASYLANPVQTGSLNFVRKVGYTVGYTWGGDTASGDEVFAFATNVSNAGSPAAGILTTSAANAIPGANDGNLVMNISIAASATPVVQGSYSDTLTIAFASVL
jgi:hypothetical protein